MIVDFEGSCNCAHVGYGNGPANVVEAKVAISVPLIKGLP